MCVKKGIIKISLKKMCVCVCVRISLMFDFISTHVKKWNWTSRGIWSEAYVTTEGIFLIINSIILEDCSNIYDPWIHSFPLALSLSLDIFLFTPLLIFISLFRKMKVKLQTTRCVFLHIGFVLTLLVIKRFEFWPADFELMLFC